jgi:hypothetical protein
MARISKTQRLRQYTGLIKFAHDHPEMRRLTLDMLGGKKVAAARLGKILQAYVDAAARTQAALDAYRSAVRAEEALLAKAHPTALRMTNLARLLLGGSSPRLALYGIKPEKRTKKRAAALTAQIEKLRASRKARGAMGRRQRQAAARARAVPGLRST